MFTHMPFGLRNAPAVFQSLMESVLKNCRAFSSVYIDDVLNDLDSWSFVPYKVCFTFFEGCWPPSKCHWPPSKCHWPNQPY